VSLERRIFVIGSEYKEVLTGELKRKKTLLISSRGEKTGIRDIFRGRTHRQLLEIPRKRSSTE